MAKPHTRPRFWIALALGVAAGALALLWPASPRLAIPFERTCWDLAFSPDGTRLAILDREAGLDQPGHILVADAATGAVLHRLDYGVAPYPSRLAFAPDGKSLGLVDTGAVLKWDLDTGRLAARYDHAGWSHDPEHHYGRELLFSPEGRWLAHNVHEGRVYDAETGAVVHDYADRWPDRQPSAHGGCVAAFVDGEVRTFDAVTGAELGVFPTARGFGGMMNRAGMYFSADGTRGAYFGDRGRWVVRDATTGREWALPLTGDTITSEIALSGRRVAVVAAEENAWTGLRSHLGGGRWHARVLDAATGAHLGHTGDGWDPCCFTPDSRTLAVTNPRQQRVMLWDVPPRPRWPWAAALGAGTFVLALTVTRFRARRPAHLANSPPAG